MGHTLKLSIYSFFVNDKKRGKPINLGDCFSTIYGKNESDTGDAFDYDYNEYLRLFGLDVSDMAGGQFLENVEATKAMAIESYSIFPKSFVVDGMIKGGLTGIDQDIYKKNNSIVPESKIDKTKVASLPYYFKMWLPIDSQVGIIMVQSFTETGVTSLFVDVIKKYFFNKGFNLHTHVHVPDDVKESFKNRSEVKQITLIKTKLSKKSRSSLNQVFADFQNLKITVKITGFRSSIQDIIENLSKNPIVVPDFEMEGASSYETVAVYEDNHGHQSSAKFSKNVDITPTILLDDYLKEDGKESVDLSKIRDYTNTVLNTIKGELEYKPL